MKIKSEYNIEHRTASIVQSPYKGFVGLSMIMPGGSTCCGSSCSCSCGTITKQKKD